MSTGLTPLGRSQLTKLILDSSTRFSDLLVVSDSDGIGGLLMAVDLLGVGPDGLTVIEQSIARAVVKERWPRVVCYSGIREMSQETSGRFLKKKLRNGGGGAHPPPPTVLCMGVDSLAKICQASTSIGKDRPETGLHLSAVPLTFPNGCLPVKACVSVICSRVLRPCRGSS